MSTILAVLLVLFLAVVVFVVTRKLPNPSPPTPQGPCTKNSDCPSPQVCSAGSCINANVSAPLQAAQNAAQALNTSLQAQQTAIQQGALLAQAQNISSAAVAKGLSPPNLMPLQNDLEAVGSALGKIMGTMSIPNCDVSRSPTCGYYAELAAMTPATPPGVMASVAESAITASAELESLTSVYTAVAEDIVTITTFITADAAAKNISLDFAFGVLLGNFEENSEQCQTIPAALQQQADQMSKTACSLYQAVTGVSCPA